MPKEKRDEKKKKLYQDKISLHPVAFGEAVADILKVKPKSDKADKSKEKESRND